MAPAVLLVDDDLGTLETFQALLKISGYNVITASTSYDALAVAVRTKPDVILLALQLDAHANGFSVLRAIREVPLAAPVVMMTAFGTIELAVEAMKLGAQDFLSKPLALDDMVQSIAHALGLPAAAASQPDVSVDQTVPPTRAHAATRWAAAIVRVVDAPDDPRTVEIWGRTIGASRGTLRSWCRTAGVTVKQSLDLARLIRAVSASARTGWPPERFLDSSDERTIQRLARAGGLSLSHVASSEILLERQVLVKDLAALSELSRALRRRSVRVPRGIRP